MTLSEFRQAVAESQYSEWYNNYTINLSYPHLNFSISLKGISTIYEFILKQIDGFNEVKSLPEEIDKNFAVFREAKRRILDLFNQTNIQENNWNGNLRPIISPTPPLFLITSPETQFLLKIHQEQPQYYKGSYEYFVGSTQHVSNKAYLNGYLLAYEFVSKEFSEIGNRKNAEEKSLSKLKKDFQQKISEAETQLTEYISKTKEKYEDYVKIIDTLKESKEGSFSTWFKNTTINFQEFNTKSSQSVKELEQLYKEKLKLEAPAKYWNDRAAKLRKEGKRWLSALVACIIISVFILIWTLSKIADGTIQTIFNETGTAVKWSVAFITLISFLAYGLRVFSKLTFSSFHLVRDAEEREQLTYVYLALQKEKAIDQTERHLVMQSLFSRADSGLLKDDASPTMPGNIVDQITKK